ncbi:hypothetical protein A4E84_00710 [Streptomyces qaidamensis]|uniref:Uncharacterized protein n=1 Tax=Streptomyces qaidamensis TaxID=1783515 RepID=A0A143BTM5_9ACTN|nr:hypothetical protein A4E84_00710 [Streptomyces qaidamensis]
MRRCVLDATTSSALHGKWDVRKAWLLVGPHTRVPLPGLEEASVQPFVLATASPSGSGVRLSDHPVRPPLPYGWAPTPGSAASLLVVPSQTMLPWSLRGGACFRCGGSPLGTECPVACISCAVSGRNGVENKDRRGESVTDMGVGRGAVLPRSVMSAAQAGDHR